MDNDTHWHVWIQPVLNKTTNKWEVEVKDEQNKHIKTFEYDTEEQAKEGLRNRFLDEVVELNTGTK